MSRPGVRSQPSGWASVVAGIGAVIALTAALALIGLVLAGVAAVVLS